MRVKRYVVDTLPDALNKIRQELGKDAVILNTKQLRVGGFLGIFSKKKIEVIAAIDSAGTAVNAEKAQRTALAAVASADREPPAPVVGTTVAAQAYRHSAQRAGTAVMEPADNRPLRPHVAEASRAEKPEETVQLPPQDHAVERFKRAAAQSIQEAAARQTMQQSSEPVSAQIRSSELDPNELLSEIKEMKALVAKLSGGIRPTEAPETPAATPFAAVEQRLIGQGVSPAVVAELKQSAMNNCELPLDEIDAATARSLIREQILRLFQTYPASGISEQSRIVQFVGPTGVGKTTTIAKLAAEQVLKHNKQVGFITSDTYRIAAIDQLKTYATILNVPVEVVFSPDEMPEALEKLSDRSLIFMDTAGRNYRDEASVEELNGLVSEHGKSETYLVLSLVSKYEDIKAIIDNFKHFKLDKVLWTKMDETVSYGSVLNVLSEYSLPLSYITHGQNVPDDISLLHPETIVEHLLGEDAYG